jgi:hypothetical protein
MSDIFNTCGPRIIDVSNTCDGSLTKADITGLTPATIDSMLANTAIDEAFLYRQMMLARISGARENSLMELMMSRITNVKGELTKTSLGPNKSFFLPYILREQEDNINVNAFQIDTVGDAGTTPLVPASAGSTVSGVYIPTHAWQITVRGTDSAFYTQVSKIARYFLPEEYVAVMNNDGGGNTQEPYFKIIAAEDYVDASEPSIPKARVIIAPNVTEAGFGNIAVVPDPTVFQPVNGVVMLGVNSISDYESWCHQQPTEMSKRVIAHWHQTSRFSHCYDDVTKEYLKRIMDGKVNPYLQKFKELPLSEQNRRQFAVYERKLMNSFWYGQPIDENQTVETYQQLPKIYDPRKPDTFLEYKSNAIGVKEQLRACQRIVDRGGQPIDFNFLEESLYNLKRYREADGGSVEQIDCFTDRFTAQRIRSLMSDVYKNRYGVQWTREWRPMEKIEFGQQVLFNYQSYSFDEAGIMLNVFVHPFFSDFKLHFSGNNTPAGLSTRGNQLIMVDWNDLQWGVMGTASRTSRFPNLETDEDFQCRIKANIETVEMQSVSWSPIIEDPKRHLIWENFSDACPEMDVENCDVTP